MTTPTIKLYPSAPREIENYDLEQRLEMKLNDVKSSNISIINFKEVIIYFENKNQKSKKRSNTFKKPACKTESVNTVANNSATTLPITFSVFDAGFIPVLISAGIASALSLSNKALHKTITKKTLGKKNQYEKDQQTNETLDKLYRKSLQLNILDENESESAFKVFNNYDDEMRNETCFIKVHKILFFL